MAGISRLAEEQSPRAVFHDPDAATDGFGIVGNVVAVDIRMGFQEALQTARLVGSYSQAALQNVAKQRGGTVRVIHRRPTLAAPRGAPRYVDWRCRNGAWLVLAWNSSIGTHEHPVLDIGWCAHIERDPQTQKEAA
jgi:hypothetical protein